MLNGRALVILTLILVIGLFPCAFGATVIQLAAGWGYTVALKSDGTVWAWGTNSYGELGDGTTTERHAPAQIPGLSGMVAIAASREFTVALKNDGTVWAWGTNYSGQLGDGTTTAKSTPVMVSGLTGVIAIAAGFDHTVALKNDGTVWVWGNAYVGDGTTTNSLIPAQATGISGVTAVAAAQYHTVALKNDGTVWSWGGNYYGELGDGTNVHRYTPVQVSALSGVTAIAAGGWDGQNPGLGGPHTVALKSDGTVWTWGDNSYGQLGAGRSRNAPAQVLGVTEVAAISAGCHYTLALKSDGTVWACGENAGGQLGDGTTVTRSSPVQVSGLTEITAIAAGWWHTFALKSDGTVWGWGENGCGELSDGTAGLRTTPSQVAALSGVTAIATGDIHALALKSDGTVWAWGDNTYGKLGDGTTVRRPIPVQFVSLSSVTAVAGAADHTVALRSDGTVWTWGDNSSGQLGNGTYTRSLIPVQASGVAGVTAICAGGKGTAALKNDGTVWTWGQSCCHSKANTPAQIPGLSGVVAIARGGAFNGSHTLALMGDGTVWAFGYNYYGQLGDGTTIFGLSPIQVSDLSGVTAVAAGATHSVALKSDGTVWTWGRNDRGQLGDGTSTVERHTPVQVLGLSGITAIAAGAVHTVALRSDGTVWAWGDNQWGQIGDGTLGYYPQKHSPVQVSGLSGVTAIAAGGAFTAAIRGDATFYSWGDDVYGQLGDGHFGANPLPIQVLWPDTVAPTGSFTINGGAPYTASQNVTLALSAADDKGVVRQMSISNDGMFDTVPWEDYATAKDWVLGVGEGTKTLWVRFKDPTGNESETTSASIILDTTPPAVTVTVAPTMAAKGDSVQVTVGATDLNGVDSLTSSDVSLTKTGAATWEGTILAASAVGSHPIGFVATDVAGNPASASGSYLTASILGIAGSGISDPLRAFMASSWLVRVWGVVTVVDSNTFDLDNGSGRVVRVTAPGYTGIENGDYASARGILHTSTSPKSLSSSAGFVDKLN